MHQWISRDFIYYRTYLCPTPPSENVTSSLMRTAKGPDQSDQGFYCPLTESLDPTECMNGEKKSR